jgi:hypothetical protein
MLQDEGIPRRGYFDRCKSNVYNSLVMRRLGRGFQIAGGYFTDLCLGVSGNSEPQFFRCGPFKSQQWVQLKPRQSLPDGGYFLVNEENQGCLHVSAGHRLAWSRCDFEQRGYWTGQIWKFY